MAPFWLAANDSNPSESNGEGSSLFLLSQAQHAPKASQPPSTVSWTATSPSEEANDLKMPVSALTLELKALKASEALLESLGLSTVEDELQLSSN